MTPPPDPPELPEDLTVAAYKMEALIVAGYPEDDASMLAHAGWVDWHVAVDLLAAGCAESLAVEILI